MLKKYRNRRLYDDEASGYTTVAQVRNRLLAGESVQPALSITRSSDEVTNETLIGIIQYDCARGYGPTPDELRKFISDYSALRRPEKA